MNPRALPHAPEVVTAARWLADQRQQLPRPLVPFLKRRFGVEPSAAIEAIDLAGRMLLLRRAFA
ncbi:hypothetical protein ACLE20_15080 [Rhizobium sp. YIM 134829]|uniref:hypothetical protein n=1 Tax=Rhizobium sp. YIM 134829 TaxID=3390453 RepID=UPI00397D4274